MAGLCHEEGFSLIELAVSMAIAVTVMAVCIAWVPPMTEVVQADSDMQTLRSEVSLARERAANQRRSVQLQFLGTDVVQTVRQNPDGSTTILGRAVLQHNMQYLRFAGQPDTPDSFGGSGAVNLGGAASVFFTADGTLTDAGGNPINVTIFLGQPSKPLTSRAVTIFGPTARVRGYRWNGTQWRQ